MSIINGVKGFFIKHKKILTPVILDVLLVLAAFIVFSTSAKTVIVNDDGKVTEYTTRESKVSGFLKSEGIIISEDDEVIPAVDEKLTKYTQITINRAITVAIEDGGETVFVKTPKKRVIDALYRAKIPFLAEDKITPGLDTRLNEGDKITIKRAVPVTLIANGTTSQVYSADETVHELLVNRGIILSENDYTTPAPDTKITENMQITLVDVDFKFVTQEEEIPYKTVQKANNNLEKGITRIIQEGKNGKRTVDYKVRYENGAEVSREKIAEKVIAKAQDKIIEYGTVSVATTSRGESFRYTKVLECIATAYDPGPESNGKYAGKTATGRKPEKGVIAVDPKVIPLGSRVYVEAADGSWVYGYAVAADTGSAIKGNKVDLCFNTRQEALNFGRRKCKVYILQ